MTVKCIYLSVKRLCLSLCKQKTLSQTPLNLILLFEIDYIFCGGANRDESAFTCSLIFILSFQLFIVISVTQKTLISQKLNKINCFQDSQQYKIDAVKNKLASLEKNPGEVNINIFK